MAPQIKFVAKVKLYMKRRDIICCQAATFLIFILLQGSTLVVRGMSF